MRKYLFCEAGFIEKPNWLPNCWVNVECPTPDDFVIGNNPDRYGRIGNVVVFYEDGDT